MRHSHLEIESSELPGRRLTRLMKNNPVHSLASHRFGLESSAVSTAAVASLLLLVTLMRVGSSITHIVN